MKPINGVTLTSRLDPGSTKRLRDYSTSLSNDREKINHDAHVERLLFQYVRDKAQLQDIRMYLRHVKDADGYPFSQSLKQYSKLTKQVYRFAEEQVSSFRWNKNYQKALKVVESWFSSTRSLNPLCYSSDSDIKDALDKTDTHSGWNYILTGSKKKGENMTNVLRKYRKEESDAISNGSFNKPILIGTRTQCSGAFEDESGKPTGTCKHKTRLVSMIDMYQIIAECRFAVPIQRVMSRMNSYAGGKDNREISTILLNYRRKYSSSLTVDYSSYDQTVPSWLIQDAFSVLRGLFKPLSVKDSALFDVIVSDFINKNFVLSPTEVVYARKGIPSGSRFTQIIGTVCNWIMITTFLIARGLEGDMIVMGDDNIIFTHVVIDRVELASYLEHNFGVEVNPDKMSECLTSEDPWFLSRKWMKFGEWRHPNVLISKLKYPERWRDYEPRSSPLKPEHIIYSYILTYANGMNELMYTDKFVRDFNLTPRSLPQEVLRQMAYADRAFRQY